jgi:hypothetical protein
MRDRGPRRHLTLTGALWFVAAGMALVIAVAMLVEGAFGL